MKALMDKKGFVNPSVGGVTALVLGFVGIVIFILVAAALFPELTSAGSDLQTSGISFANFWGTGGLVFILISIAMLIAVVKVVMPKGRK